MDRRNFTTMLLGGTGLLAAPAMARSRKADKLALYSAAGKVLTRYDLDTAAATLVRQEAIELPSAIQYAWPHPSRPVLYVATSDAPGGSRTISGKVHRLCALRIGKGGALTLLSNELDLPQRPIHITVDPSGRFLLVAYNTVADVAVHPIRADGSVGPRLAQHAQLDTGIFPHQVRTIPGNRSVVLVTRGNNANASHAEDPGALKVYGFSNGQLSPLQSIAVGGKGGLGYGPRHLDFHPRRPWTYVSVERQNELHMHRLDGAEIVAEPCFVRKTTDQSTPGVHQVAGAIHVHPHGHVVYLSNRSSGTQKVDGQTVARRGDNSIAVFSLDPKTGEPTLIQRADPRGYHVRSFALDPEGALMVAATMVAMPELQPDGVRIMPAGLSVFRVERDGTLAFQRKYDVALEGEAQQVWVGIVPVA